VPAPQIRFTISGDL